MKTPPPPPQPQASRAAAVWVAVTSAVAVTLLLLPASAIASDAASPAPSKSHAAKKVFPSRTVLTDDKVGHWAVVLRNVPARRLPRASSSVVTTLGTVTSEETQNLVLVLARVDVDSRHAWYKVRLPILPNNSTGWVPRSALGNLYTVHTHLYVDRKAFTARLERDGRTIFTTRIGVGRGYWPTPRGQFYVRNKLTDLNNPVYGPLAFGTSARSAVLTDWPGGGFIGIHGTNEPSILPGAVSHGCIRLRNEAIVKLSRLMQVGTPLTVT